MQSNTPSDDELTANITGIKTHCSQDSETKLDLNQSGSIQANSSGLDAMSPQDVAGTTVSANPSPNQDMASQDSDSSTTVATNAAPNVSVNTSVSSPDQGDNTIINSSYSSSNIPPAERASAIINYAANSYAQDEQEQESSNSLRPTTFVAKPESEFSQQPNILTTSDVLSQTAQILSQNFSATKLSSEEDESDDAIGNSKPQLNELDPSQWSAQTAAYNQKVLNRIKVKPLCDPVGKPLSNPQGTPASKPFLDLPIDFLNTTIECHDGICEVIEGEDEPNVASTGLGDLTQATAPQEQNLTEELRPEDISVPCEQDATITAASLPPATEALSFLTQELSASTDKPLTPNAESQITAFSEAASALKNNANATDGESTEPLDQHSLPQGSNASVNQVQATTLNLRPLSQKSASQALHQGENSSVAAPSSHLPMDFISGSQSSRNILSTPKQAFDLDLQNLSRPTHGLRPPMITPSTNFSQAKPSEVSPAQVTAMALQAAQAKITMSKKGESPDSSTFATIPPDLANFINMPGMPGVSKPMASMITELNGMQPSLEPNIGQGAVPPSAQVNPLPQTTPGVDPMFSFQQSMAQGYGTATQVNATPSQASENIAQPAGTMALHSVHSLNKINRMPGLVLYKLKNNTVFYDCYAAEFLGIGTEAGNCTLRKFLHMIGRPVVHDLITRLKPLSDELKISSDNICTSMNVVNLSCVLPQGVCKGATVYVRVAAFFDEQGQIRYYTFTFMRQMPNNMAFIPDLLTNNTSFAWLVQEDKLSLSQHYYKLLGYPEQNEPLILSFSTWENTLVHPHDRVALEKIMPIIDSPSNGNSFEICYRSRKINGTYIWTKSIGTVIARDAQGKATRVIGVNCDINEMVDGYDRLRSKVYTDVLTGLKNRTYLVQHVRDFIQPQMQPLSILFFDATALKLYNDYLGHAMGDKLLFSIANILNENIAFENELIRISGDEMLCILPMCDELMLQMVMDDISAALEAYNVNAPVRMPVFFSMGNITINLNTQLYNRMRMQYAKQLKNQDQNNLDPNRMFNRNVALNRTLAWQNWSPDDKQLDMAYELFFQAVQQADKNMQEAKQANREEHYALIRAYIEQTLHKHIDLDDKRLLNIDRGMLA